MGTKKQDKEKIKKEIEEIQQDIKEMLGKIGWSGQKFAQRVYYEKFDTDVEEEIKQFIEKFKKDISRKSTTLSKLEELKEYRKILYSLDEVKKADIILPKHHSKKKFSPNFNKKMREVSGKIDKALKQKENLNSIE